MDPGKLSRELYAAALLFIEAFRTLVGGCGVVELTSKFIPRRVFPLSFSVTTGSINFTGTVAKLQEDHPGIFGRNGGYSRTFS